MNSTNEILHQVTEISVMYHSKVKPSDRISIKRSDDAYKLLRENWNDTLEIFESFKILLLNRANKVLGISVISVGGVSGTVVDPKKVFATALLSGCSSIILCHNHPSGQLQPSDADRNITKKLCNGATLLEMSVVDHLIISSESFYSFADNGDL